eukprot:4409224-Amphidinium_carterae.1
MCIPRLSVSRVCFVLKGDAVHRCATLAENTQESQTQRSCCNEFKDMLRKLRGQPQQECSPMTTTHQLRASTPTIPHNNTVPAKIIT